MAGGETTLAAAGRHPSAALLTLFAATLERWSRTTAFTLNLTFFNRQPIHPQINQLIGDLPPSRWLILTSTPLTLQEQMQRTQQRSGKTWRTAK